MKIWKTKHEYGGIILKITEKVTNCVGIVGTGRAKVLWVVIAGYEETWYVKTGRLW